jgi:hypothetical protein
VVVAELWLALSNYTPKTRRNQKRYRKNEGYEAQFYRRLLLGVASNGLVTGMLDRR